MKLVREPLVHFLAAGALLFAAHAWLGRGDDGAGGAGRTVRITEREMAWLAETWMRQWQRPPSESELHGLVADYLREELLAREARELELDLDDTVVRRRLAQKMSFLLEDTARLAEPGDGELRALYETRRASFETPARTTFLQVYFSPDRRGGRAAEDARAALARLAAGDGPGDAAELGDPSLLPAEVVAADEQAIAGWFGPGFARAAGALPPGAWQGPIDSAFGLHLVRVVEREEARPLPFEEVRAELAGEWRREREASAKEAYFAGLLQKYDVQVAPSLQPLVGPALATVSGEGE